MFHGFYKGKRVLVTGHTGFKGGWLSLWLKLLEARVWGLSLPPPTNPSFYEVIKPLVFAGDIQGDIRNLDLLAGTIQEVRPDILFHLAAQPLVRRSYTEPLETFQTNALGTANLLEAVRRAELPCTLVIITSDKCYENREWELAYRENDPMGGHDIYSMSKGVAELLCQAWNKSFFLPNDKLGPLATARAGNVIGGGDYAQDRLVPDCVRALIDKRPILVRNPRAVRPWQHVLECSSGYLWLGARLGVAGKNSPLAGGFNFGPGPTARHSVRDVVQEFLKHWPGQWVDGSDPNQPHEAGLLALAIDKASALLDWRPVWTFQEAIRHTTAWYKGRHAAGHPDLAALALGQIETYVDCARRQGLAWTAPEGECGVRSADGRSCAAPDGDGGAR
jgi:CDP-glucose 4,6-dehydratase